MEQTIVVGGVILAMSFFIVVLGGTAWLMRTKG